MSETVFSFPGKAGDAIHQWPIAYWWARETGKKFTCWMDEATTKMVAPLFTAQPCVEGVEFKPGVEGYNCGGQPWHFGIKPEDCEGKEVHHLGLRVFPQRQLTLECLEHAKLGLKVDIDTLTDTPSLEVPTEESNERICLLHGQAVYPHTKSTPRFWTFLSDISGQLQERFNRIIFVGNESDREAGMQAYPHWEAFDDNGSFLELAKLMKRSDLVIGCGSSVVALAGALKVNSVRVHDPIGDHPKVIWSNLQRNHLNLPELELRLKWSDWRDKYIDSEVKVG